MPTHYDVLGVAPDAPTEAVRRAYLDLARRLHPDLGGADVDERSRRMQAVNEAWRVLGDPARRARYDRSLRPPAPPRRPRPPESESDLDTPIPHPIAEPGDLGVSIARALPWLALLFVLGAIFVFTAFAGGGSSSKAPQELVGKCVSFGSASSVRAVPCDGPNDGEVVLVVDRASLCPDGTDARAEGDTWLCLRAVHPG